MKIKNLIFLRYVLTEIYIYQKIRRLHIRYSKNLVIRFSKANGLGRF